MGFATDHAPGCDRGRVIDAAPGHGHPAWPSCRQDGSREQREESDRESALPGRARTGMGAFVRCHGELHRRAGDAPPILCRWRSQVSADTLVYLRLATGVWELHARHMQVLRKDRKNS